MLSRSRRLLAICVWAAFVPLLLFLSFLCGWYVWVNVSVGFQVPLYLQFGDGLAPYASVALPKLILNQSYSISLDLVLPSSPSNLQLGNFMSSLTLTSLSNTTVTHVRRPAIVLPQISRFFFAAPTTILLNIPLLDDFRPPLSFLSATIQLGRKDSWVSLGNGHSREVSVISASLRGFPVPSGIRGLAIRFPLLSAASAAAIFFIFVFLAFSFIFLPILFSAAFDESSQKSQQAIRTAPQTRKKRRSRSTKSSTERTSIKLEETSTSESKSLRRRPSRPLIDSSDAET